MGRGLKRVALATSTALTLAAALLVGTASAAGADLGPDLSSRAAIERYLVSIGVDPADAVWQQGLKNYAGPSCPGLDWNCVPANAPIVQIAASLGTNQYFCTAPECVVVQVPLGAGQNQAGCDRGDKHADVAVQECVITQTNTTGNNTAVINQSIEQTNGSGKNLAGFHQVIHQSSQVRGSTQSQDAHQAATLDQRSGSGDNSANTNQRQDQTQKASGATDTIIQKQNTAEDDDFFCDGSIAPLATEAFDQDKNQCAEIMQDSTSGGGLSDLNQLIRESQTASNAPTVDQEQGQPPVGDPPFLFPGGQGGTVVQDSSAPVDSKALQDMVQSQRATGITDGVEPEDQFKSTGDPRCCATQTLNPESSADVIQITDQSASSEGAVQVAAFIGTCNSSGSCHVFQSATIDGDPDTNECDSGPPGGFCDEVRICTEEPVGEGDETETVCTDPDFDDGIS
jgi:hypothetical protein